MHASAIHSSRLAAAASSWCQTSRHQNHQQGWHAVLQVEQIFVLILCYSIATRLFLHVISPSSSSVLRISFSRQSKRPCKSRKLYGLPILSSPIRQLPVWEGSLSLCKDRIQSKYTTNNQSHNLHRCCLGFLAGDPIHWPLPPRSMMISSIRDVSRSTNLVHFEAEVISCSTLVCHIPLLSLITVTLSSWSDALGGSERRGCLAQTRRLSLCWRAIPVWRGYSDVLCWQGGNCTCLFRVSSFTLSGRLDFHYGFWGGTFPPRWGLRVLRRHFSSMVDYGSWGGTFPPWWGLQQKPVEILSLTVCRQQWGTEDAAKWWLFRVAFQTLRASREQVRFAADRYRYWHL